jgi:hypothetical protein
LKIKALQTDARVRKNLLFSEDAVLFLKEWMTNKLKKPFMFESSRV